MNAYQPTTGSGIAAGDAPTAPIASRVIPENLAYLIEERSTLWHESGGDYDSLRAAIFAELKPEGVIECILIKNLVDYVWEARRYRRLKAAAIHAEMPAVAGQLLVKEDTGLFGNSYPDRQLVMRLARAVVAGVGASDNDSLDIRAGSEHVTSDVLHYEAYKRDAEMHLHLNRECERMERRRDQLLKQIEDRRAALGAMARSLIKREAAEAILHLHRVQTSRRLAEEAAALLNLQPLAGAPTRVQMEERHPTLRSLVAELRRQARDAGYTADAEITAIDGILCLLLSLRSQHDEVRRLNEYERRALSRRRTALRRLDYERIEAERRAADQAAA